jgi:hypothetical protein
LLRRGKEGLGPIAFWTIRVKAEVALQVRYDRGGVVLGVVDLGQKKISFGKIRLPEERLLRATLRFRGTIQRKLRPAQEDFPQRRTRIKLKALLNDRLRLTKLLHLAENHSHHEISRRVAPSREIDGFLKGLFRLGGVAKQKVREPFIVMGPVVAWIFCDCAIKIGNASGRVFFQEQLDLSSSTETTLSLIGGTLDADCARQAAGNRRTATRSEQMNLEANRLVSREARMELALSGKVSRHFYFREKNVPR